MSDQPLNDAWGQGADGKWYPPEQLPEAAGSSKWTWLAVALGGLVSLVVLVVIGGAIADGPAEIDASARPAPSTTSELGRTTTTTTTTSTTTSTTTTTSAPTTTTAAPPPPTTAAPSPPPPPAPPLPPAPAPAPAAPSSPQALVASPEASGVHYENCAAVRAAGAAPVHRGQPGYASHLDRDDDGVGCE